MTSTDTFLDYGPAENCDPGACVIDSYRRFINLRDANPDFVPVLTIGNLTNALSSLTVFQTPIQGGYAFGSAVWSNMAKDPAKRALFIQSLLDFADQFGWMVDVLFS